MGRIEYQGEILVDSIETAEILGLSRRQLRRLRNRGLLRRVRVPNSRSTFTPLEDIEIIKSSFSVSNIRKLQRKIEELERKVAWLMNNIPTPEEHYKMSREMLRKNHPDVFS